MARGYFYSPAQQVTSGGRIYYRPRLANAVDANGGHWKIVCSDADNPPTKFVCAVNDRRHPSLPRNTQAILDALHDVPGVVFLGTTQKQARQEITDRIGPAALARFMDQEVGSE